MKTADGKISKPIRDMIEGDEFGRVIFKVGSFRQKFNTRTAALGNRRRHGFDIYTKSENDDELQVIHRGFEHLPGLVVDLTALEEGCE